MENNNRKRERVNFKYSVMSFKCMKNTDEKKICDKPLFLEVSDISYSGIGMSVNQKMEVGNHIMINLSDGMDKLEYDLIVRWCKGTVGRYKVGCEFVDLTKEKVYLLHRIIKQK